MNGLENLISDIILKLLNERTRIKEKQKEGIKIAVVKAMELLNIKINTFYRRVKEYESIK